MEVGIIKLRECGDWIPIPKEKKVVEKEKRKQTGEAQGPLFIHFYLSYVREGICSPTSNTDLGLGILEKNPC